MRVPYFRRVTCVMAYAALLQLPILPSHSRAAPPTRTQSPRPRAAPRHSDPGAEHDFHRVHYQFRSGLPLMRSGSLPPGAKTSFLRRMVAGEGERSEHDLAEAHEHLRAGRSQAAYAHLMNAARSRAAHFQRLSEYNRRMAERYGRLVASESDNGTIARIYLTAAENAQSREQVIAAVVQAARFLPPIDAVRVTLRLNRSLTARHGRWSSRLHQALNAHLRTVESSADLENHGSEGIVAISELANELAEADAHRQAQGLVASLLSRLGSRPRSASVESLRTMVEVIERGRQERDVPQSLRDAIVYHAMRIRSSTVPLDAAVDAALAQLIDVATSAAREPR